jgi:hypothetical protein
LICRCLLSLSYAASQLVFDPLSISTPAGVPRDNIISTTHGGNFPSLSFSTLNHTPPLTRPAESTQLSHLVPSQLEQQINELQYRLKNYIPAIQIVGMTATITNAADIAVSI